MKNTSPVIIVGAGYTGSRLALHLVAREIPVFAAARNPEKLAPLAAAGIATVPLFTEKLPKDARLVYSVPPLPAPEAHPLFAWLRRLCPARFIYISSTGVYGNHTKINENSPAEGSGERARLRIADERWFAAGPWSTLILRPAAIYGPGRGVHIRVRQGLVPRGAGSHVTSRIHVDDLVQLISAGLNSELTGAWPAADREPCPTLEIAEWCAQRMNTEVCRWPASGSSDEGRAVDASATFSHLGVDYLWPTWRTGIPACLAEEQQLPGF